MKQPSSLPLISFRRLQGGQFGTLDVSTLGQHLVQFALGGGDFVRMNRKQWIAMRSILDRFFNCERETVVVRTEFGEPIVFEEREREVVREEQGVVEGEVIPPPPAPTPARAKRARRRAAA